MSIAHKKTATDIGGFFIFTGWFESVAVQIRELGVSSFIVAIKNNYFANLLNQFNIRQGYQFGDNFFAFVAFGNC